ncbi:electron transport complex subunit RsxG [Aliiglaciecola sp. LCG003]|uniref:electron transport complex subunit RsxG n=1 Tax=Aliiglaciecola sp. LCG003 TaxID=3053655 RepID=UPI002572F3FB|nr:electron transport complex subunit RsxG [Aliiglaciecola sp. LCG003]WJG08278.1 electron transport complex subunit RsxG [Aliiglaciecola sp. LCG003]
MKKSVLQNGLILSSFALATTALIALTFVGTKDKITEQQVQKRLSILSAIIPPSSYNNDIHHDCTDVYNAEFLGSDEAHRVYFARMQGAPVAAALEVTAANGYSGKIELIVGIKIDGEVAGVRVLEHKETPGLGDKIELRVSDWVLDFNGKSIAVQGLQAWQVKKDGGQFDQFTGATITPRAVVNAVKNSILYFQQHQTELFAAEGICEHSKDSAAGGS